MHYLVDTETLQREGLMTATLAQKIEERSRQAMLALGVNTVLAGGIAAAAGGLIFWLADTLAVAITGSIFLALGALILLRAGPLYRMLGNAAGLIGGGMLAGGATLKLLEKATPATAAITLMLVGGIGMLLSLWLARRDGKKAGFLLGSITLMAAGMHLVGLYTGLTLMPDGFGPASLAHLYATLLLLALGYLLDVRFVTALAVVPFAQVLDTSTSYFHAAYVFYSPEPSLSILQMALAMIAALWLVQTRAERIGRHAGIFAILSFVVGNLCFLVGSLWGDVIGQSFRGYDEAAAPTAGLPSLEISADVFSLVWALALLAMLGYATYRHRRGLFNAALTFAALHAYTQLFERFGDAPLAFVVGGLAAVPLAWGMWRINERFRTLA